MGNLGGPDQRAVHTQLEATRSPLAGREVRLPRGLELGAQLVASLGHLPVGRHHEHVSRDVAVELVRRWFTGQFRPIEMLPIFFRIGNAYLYDTSPLALMSTAIHGGWRWRPRPQALIFAGRHLLRDRSVVDRLGEIRAPTLVIAGRQDFVFPPECQDELAAGIPGARLRLIDRAGHNPHDEQATEVIQAIRSFISETPLPA